MKTEWQSEDHSQQDAEVMRILSVVVWISKLLFTVTLTSGSVVSDLMLLPHDVHEVAGLVLLCVLQVLEYDPSPHGVTVGVLPVLM
jgi:hypothetical protein